MRLAAVLAVAVVALAACGDDAECPPGEKVEMLPPIYIQSGKVSVPIPQWRCVPDR